jgi:hypothetical protein
VSTSRVLPLKARGICREAGVPGLVARGGIEPPTYRFSAGQVRAMCYPPYLLALLAFRTSSAAAITLSLKAARPQ